MNDIINGFPKNIKSDVETILKIIPKETYNNVNIRTYDDNICYNLNGENIVFPYRLYLIDISDDILNNLSEQEKNIVHCLYTRSCDGYVREKHLKSLLNSNYDEWVIPYIVKICDEYVIELLELTYLILKDRDNQKIKQFCIENVEIFCKNYNRMISYWNEFYRVDCYKFKDYIGRKLFRDIFGYNRSMENKN